MGRMISGATDDVAMSFTVSVSHALKASSIYLAFLSPEDNILIIDDFLANGCALLGLIDIVKHAGAKIAGAGIVIEKGCQKGGELVRSQGIRVESLAIIDEMDPVKGCKFRDDD